MGKMTTLTIERDESKDNFWILKRGEEAIETYSISETISFSKLMRLFLLDEFKSDFALDDSKISEPNTYERKLISMLKEIIGEYRKSLSEYEAFIAEGKPVTE